MYFYIYVHLDKAKIATSARLKPPDVIKRDKSRRLNVGRNITMLKTARFRSRATKIVQIWQQHDAEKKLRRFLEGKLQVTLSCRLATTQNHQKNVHVHLWVASRIRRNQSACVI